MDAQSAALERFVKRPFAPARAGSQEISNPAGNFPLRRACLKGCARLWHY